MSLLELLHWALRRKEGEELLPAAFAIGHSELLTQEQRETLLKRLYLLLTPQG